MGPRIRWIACVVGLCAAVAAGGDIARAAPPNALDGASVSPRTGQTSTTFTFGVHYVGAYPATSVSVVVGPRTIALNLVSGTATDGVYGGSSSLPAGTWSVTFSAVAKKGNPPSITAGSVAVAAPTPTPGPSTPPTSAPRPSLATTSSSAPAPTTVTSGTTATPVPKSATSTTGPAQATPAGVAAVAYTPEPTDPAVAAMGAIQRDGRAVVPSVLWPVMLGGLGVIGLVVAYYAFATERDQRRQALAVEAALAARRSTMVRDMDDKPARAPAVWELDARLEDAPIGTVEYLPLANGSGIGSLPEDLPTAPSRGNSRLARLTDARRGRVVDDRRSLLRRS